jgi:hypothetical protein
MQHTPCSPNSKTCHKKKEAEHATHALQPEQQDMPREEGSRTCDTCPAAPTARHATRRRKQNMQHTPCSPNSKTCHNKKETEHATHALHPRQQDMLQEEGSRTRVSWRTLFLSYNLHEIFVSVVPRDTNKPSYLRVNKPYESRPLQSQSKVQVNSKEF